MKPMILFFIIAFFTFFNGQPLIGQVKSGQDLAAIQEVVHSFSAFGDQQDAEGLDAILHAEFRTVANRLFGAEEVSLMSKELYLQLIRDKKIGGDERKLYIMDMEVAGNNATVKAVLEGGVLHFTTFLSLVKSTDGAWMIISDFPHIEKA